MKAIEKKGLPVVELEAKIYIPISLPDTLTITNMFDETIPLMATSDGSLPFSLNKKSFSATERVKIRIISGKDWGGVDWKTGKLKQGIRTHVKAVFLHMHGGGFISGSSAKSRVFTF